MRQEQEEGVFLNRKRKRKDKHIRPLALTVFSFLMSPLPGGLANIFLWLLLILTGDCLQEKKGGKEKGREKEGRMDVRIEGMEEGGRQGRWSKRTLKRLPRRL